MRRAMIGLVVSLCLAGTGYAQQTKPATSQPTTRPSSGVQAVPPSQLLDSLLKPPSAAGQPLQPIQEGPVLDATTGNNAVAPGAPQLNLMREGSYVVDRTGRLTKSADGQNSELTFDSDGKAMKDPPMIILPNLKLMQMENAVTGGAKDLRFKVTGMVTEYKGRNYILLEKVVVVPDIVQQF
ncbi:MAG TPA: hypothetical protein VH475_19640 [Tepidisphaeraceae bacterium]